MNRHLPRSQIRFLCIVLVICSEDEKALLLAELARVKKEKEKAKKKEVMATTRTHR